MDDREGRRIFWRRLLAFVVLTAASLLIVAYVSRTVGTIAFVIVFLAFRFSTTVGGGVEPWSVRRHDR